MSKNNKANKDHYVQRGRLTPDEFAREKTRQLQVSHARQRVMGPPKKETDSITSG